MASTFIESSLHATLNLKQLDFCNFQQISSVNFPRKLINLVFPAALNNIEMICTINAMNYTQKEYQAVRKRTLNISNIQKKTHNI